MRNGYLNSNGFGRRYTSIRNMYRYQNEHERHICEQVWEDGYIQAVKNMNPMPGEEPPEYTPNPYRKENA